MKHLFYATRDLFPHQTVTPEVKPLVKKGEVALTLETDLDLDAAINATRNGSVSLDAPVKQEEQRAAEQQSKPAPAT
jgi:hypothetical protein